MRHLEIIAHRGGGTGHVNPEAPPENSAPAFRWAYDRGCPACECDVRLTADKQVVVFHDSTAKRTAGTEQRVADMTLEELRSLDVGRWKDGRWSGTRVSTLSELIELVPLEGKLLIEIKPGPQIIDPLSRVVADSGKADSLSLASFNIDTIREARRAMPDVSCLWVIGFEQNDGGQWMMNTLEGPGEGEPVNQPADVKTIVHTLKSNGLSGVDASAQQPDALGPAIRETGLIAGVWTVNDAIQAETLIERGFHWLTTDKPLHMHKELTARGHEILWLDPAEEHKPE